MIKFTNEPASMSTSVDKENLIPGKRNKSNGCRKFFRQFLLLFVLIVTLYSSIMVIYDEIDGQFVGNNYLFMAVITFFPLIFIYLLVRNSKYKLAILAVSYFIIGGLYLKTAAIRKDKLEREFVLKKHYNLEVFYDFDEHKLRFLAPPFITIKISENQFINRYDDHNLYFEYTSDMDVAKDPKQKDAVFLEELFKVLVIDQGHPEFDHVELVNLATGKNKIGVDYTMIKFRGKLQDGNYTYFYTRISSTGKLITILLLPKNSGATKKIEVISQSIDENF